MWTATLVMALALHGHHVSVSELSYNAAKQEVNAKVQLFADELEAHLRGISGDERFDIRHLTESNEKVVQDFFLKSLHLSGESGNYAAEFLGHHLEGNNFIAEMRWGEVQVGALNVRNAVFIETLHAQENIIHLRASGRQQTGVCTAAHPSIHFEL